MSDAVKQLNRCAYPWQQLIIDLTGEVVPCCFWSGYGNGGKPLGNTNTNTIDEIWNGEGYRDLRARVASGDLEGHPCGSCMAYRWANGVFPRFSWSAGVTRESRKCFLSQIPEQFAAYIAGREHEVQLFEDQRALEHPNAVHDDIRRLGQGRYSVWNGWLYFSSSDNTDPAENGRTYWLQCGDVAASIGGLVRDSDSGRNLLKAYAEYQAGAVEIEAKPSMISLISTADCNIDCPGCSQNTVRVAKVQHRPETVPDVLAHVPYLSQFIWHGGEPYLIRRFREFVDGFTRQDNPNLTFGFTSNGTMISEAEAEKLKKFPRINASISIDSFQPQTFEKIRAGAKFDRVLKNLERLIELHDAPTRVFSVGMIVCKSNIVELPANLQFAFERDIGLNLSPVVVYPVTERLDIFSDFEAQTNGWREAIAQARALITDAKAKNIVSVRRIDPSGMIDELMRLLDEAHARHARVVNLPIHVADPTESLVHMSRPGVIAARTADGGALSYLEIDRGAGDYVLRVPLADISSSGQISILFVHNLLEPVGTLASQRLRAEAIQQERMRLELEVPKFAGASRGRNITWAQYGESTPEGLHVHDPEEIVTAYLRIHRDELKKQGLMLVLERESGSSISHAAAYGRGMMWKYGKQIMRRMIASTTGRPR